MQMFPAGNAIYRRETYDNYPAARAIMSCVYEGLQLPIDAALRVESRYFTQILRSKEAAAMIRSLFLSMQELNKGARRPQNVPPTKVKKLAVIGAGFMGASVGYVSAQAGIDVVLIDRDQASADKGKGHAQGRDRRTDRQGPRQARATATRSLSRITATADYDAIKDCDLIIEAVFEDRKVKAETYAKAQPLLKDGAIFASNTSTLPINSLAEEFKDQGKFIGIHFFSPVEKMMLVEIIVGKNTGDVALATALDYVRVIGKTPIVVNDSRGFFANRCVLRFTAEGLEMLMEGVPPAMIENTARMAGMPVGPLSLSDEVALDLVLKIMKATEADLGPNAIDQEQKKLLVEMVEKQGRFGRKNGKGFYDYPEKGKGQKSLWPGLVGAAAEEARSRYARRRGAEAALPGGAGGGSRAHGGGSRHHRHARGRRRLDPRLRLCARSPAARCPISTSWARRSSSSSATSWKPNTARASRRRSCWKRWRPRARPSTAASRRRSRPPRRRRSKRAIARRSADAGTHSHRTPIVADGVGVSMPSVHRASGTDAATTKRAGSSIRPFDLFAIRKALTPPSSGLPWSALPAPSAARRRGPCRPAGSASPRGRTSSGRPSDSIVNR